MLTILLIRSGTTEFDAQGRIQGTLDVPLSDEGLRQARAAAGLAINPPTPVETIAAALPLCDVVLAMSVMPGFGSQAFDPVALDKLRALRRQGGDSLLLEVDGGVNEKTVAECARAGAQLLVVGSAIFRRGGRPYPESIAELTELARAS